jgi:hypothetical protein
MARHKSFGSPSAELEQEPITFDLYDETFTCKAAVQGSVLLGFGRDTKDNASEAVLNFFSLVMSDEEYEKFEDLINSEDKIVPAETLGEIAGFLVSEYTARPTGSSSSSASTGRSNARRTSARKR